MQVGRVMMMPKVTMMIIMKLIGGISRRRLAAASFVKPAVALDPSVMLQRKQPQQEGDRPEEEEREGDERGFSSPLPVGVREAESEEEGENDEAAIEKRADGSEEGS